MRQWKLQRKGRRLLRITKAKICTSLGPLINSMSANTGKERWDFGYNSHARQTPLAFK